MPDEALTPEAFMERAATSLPAHLGIRLTKTTREMFVGEFDVKPFHMAPNGFLHAGSVVTLADSMCGLACAANLPDTSSGFTTIELKTNFFGTALEGTVTATAVPVHLGRTTHVWDCEVTHRDTGKRMALFRCTQMVLFPKS
ncbi:MAG: competence protein ComA [Ponticaulis sp.]|nr:competence protein ComA [Ponticaulis sp.]